MKNFSRIVFLILPLLLCVVSSQRRGARSKPSSFSSGIGNIGNNHGLRSKFTFSDPSNCETVNGVTTCIYTNKEKEVSLKTTLCVLGGALAFMLYANRRSRRNVQKRKAIIVAVMNQFSDKNMEQSSTVPFKQKRKLINQFASKKYTMNINVKNEDQSLLCQIKVTQLKKEDQNNQNKYIVKMFGSDKVGASQLQGVILFKSRKLCLKLSKVYDDRRKAGQMGQFDILLFQGEGTPQNIVGVWTFYGQQSSQRYSGEWTMKQVDS